MLFGDEFPDDEAPTGLPDAVPGDPWFPFKTESKYRRAVDVLLLSGNPQCGDVREAAARLFAFRAADLDAVYANEPASTWACLASTLLCEHAGANPGTAHAPGGTVPPC